MSYGLFRSIERVSGGPPHTEWNDPQTPPEDLANMVKREPRALTNPSMPTRSLEKWAVKYPEYVEVNLLLPIFALDEPARFAKLRRALDVGWIETIMPRLSGEDERRLLLLFSARALPVFENATDNNQIMRRLLQQGADIVKEGDTLKRMWALSTILSEAQLIFGQLDEETPENSALYSAIEAVNEESEAAGTAADAIGRAAKEVYFFAHEHGREHGERHGSEQAGREAQWTEQAWQAQQIKKIWLEYREDAIYERAMNQVLANLRKKERTDAQRVQAIGNAQMAAGQIARIMASDQGWVSGWPDWLGLGLVVGGTVACLLVGPEVLVGLSAEAAVGVIFDAATATGVETVSVAATMADVEAAATLGESAEAAAKTAFLEELTAKLTGSGLKVLSNVAEAVVKVAR